MSLLILSPRCKLKPYLDGLEKSLDFLFWRKSRVRLLPNTLQFRHTRKTLNDHLWEGRSVFCGRWWTARESGEKLGKGPHLGLCRGAEQEQPARVLCCPAPATAGTITNQEQAGAAGVTDIARWKGAAPRQALTQQWGNLESSPEEEPPSCPRLPLPPPGEERRAPCCPPSAPRPRGLRLIFPAGKRRAADKGMPVILANTISTPLISASCTRSEQGWRSKEGQRPRPGNSWLLKFLLGPACSGAQGPLDPAKLPPGAEGLRMMREKRKGGKLIENQERRLKLN
nr:uncharacterized protein LOC107034416 [Vicugna pacos]